MENIYLKLPSGQNYGWGICGFYLKKEISQKIKTTFLDDFYNGSVNGKLFQAISNIDFFDINNTFGKKNFGYTFFENEPNNITIENAKKYDLIFCGSTWCKEKLSQYGIYNTELLIQGIDPEIFYPVEDKLDEEKFTIFSGGKFELRKGQDLVLKAFKILREKYDDIFLINSWNNLWAETMQSMMMSEHIKVEFKGKTFQEIINNIYLINDINPEYIKTYKNIPYRKQKDIYQKTDIAIFPNRCEGGTNLVMMEYMACGKPVISSFTSGHKDIINEDNAILLKDLRSYQIKNNENKLVIDWQEPLIEDLVNKIEYAYHNRKKVKSLGKNAGNHLKNFTWKKTAENVLKNI